MSKNNIVHFPSTRTYGGVDRISSYRPGTRAEMFIALWLSGWALLTAAECVRQISRSTSSNARSAQTTEAQIYLAGSPSLDPSPGDKRPCPRKDCNFSQPSGVLRLN
jgi:hypothetical protein